MPQPRRLLALAAICVGIVAASPGARVRAARNAAPVLLQPPDQITTDDSGYAQRVLADDPAAYWRLGEPFGPAAADVVGQHPGEFLGSFGFGAPGALTDGDKALRFDGATTAVRVDRTSPLPLDGNLTVELWVNVSRDIRQTLLSTGPSREIELTLETSGVLNFYQGNGLTYGHVVSDRLSMAPGTWQHLVVTRDASTHRISFYANGVPRGAGAYQMNLASTTVPLYVGRTAAGVQYVNGTMDDVAAYTHVLTPEQIAAHYAAAAEGTHVALQLSATDPDGDSLSYSASGLPGPLSVDPVSGLISGTLTGTNAGTYTVTATASDGDLASSRTFTWIVSPLDRAPTLMPPGDQTSAEHQPVTLDVTASDPDGTALTFSAAGLPPGLAIDTAAGRIGGTPSFDAAGTHLVTVAASDGRLNTTRSFTWTITNVNRPPTMAQTPPLVTSGGASYAERVLADGPSAYWRLDEASGSVAHDWVGPHDGDVQGAMGFSAPGPLADGNPAMRFDGATTAVRIDRTSPLPLRGDLTVELWINVSQDTRQTLLSTGPSREIELTLETSGVLNFYQGNGLTYEHAVSDRLSMAPGTWQHVVVTRDAGTHRISFYVNGVPRGGGTYQMNLASTTAPLYIGRTAGGLQYVNGRIDDVAVYTHVLTPEQIAAHYAAAAGGVHVALELSAMDPDGDPLIYRATGLPASLSIDQATGLISGILTTGDAGTYSVAATVSDGSLTDGDTFTWTVLPLNRVPVLQRPPDQTSEENAPVTLDVSASDPDGTPLTFSAGGLPPGLAIDAATGRISGSPTFEAAGVHQVTLTASDGQFGTSRMFTWTVANVNRPPVLVQPDDVVSSDNAGYVQRVLSDGPAGYWRLDDAPGTTAADATGSFPGTVMGGVGFDQPGALADGDTAMRFDGATTAVTVPRGSALALAGDLTLELWVNVSLDTRQTLLSVGPAHEFELTLETSNVLNFFQGNGSTYEHVWSNRLSLAPGVWQHLVVTRDTATHTISFFVNGVPCGSGTYSMTPAASTTPLYIGRTAGGLQYVNGSIDDVAVYPYALTAAQIAVHYAVRSFSGTTVALQLTGADPDGDPLTYAASGLPGALALDPITGLITGKLTVGDAGSYLVTAIASDGSLSSSRSFVWTVATLTNPAGARGSESSRYASRVLSDGATAYWRLDEGSGTTAADMAGVHPGDLLGPVRLNQPGALTDGDTSIRFDGATTSVRVARTTPLALAGDLTLELWVDASLNTRQTLLSTGPTREFELTLETSGILNFYQGDGSRYEHAVSTRFAMPAGIWQHIVVTRTTATHTISFFVNGRPAGSAPYAMTPSGGTQPLYIGRTAGGLQYVDGWIDDVAVYGYALTPDQIAAHYALRSAVPIDALTVAADRPAPQVPGTAITLTAAATGGATPCEFKWWVLEPGGWRLAQDWSASPTFVWIPAEGDPGGRIEVWARSSGDTANSPEKRVQIPYPIFARRVARLLSPVDGASTPLDAPLTWEAVDDAQAYWLYVGTASGGDDLVNTGKLTGTSFDPTDLRERLFRSWLAWDPGPGASAGLLGYAVRIDGTRTDFGPLTPIADCGDQQPCLRVELPPLPRGSHALQASSYNALLEVAASPVTLVVPDGTVYVRVWTEVDGVWGYSDSSFSAVATTARFTFPLADAVGVDLGTPLAWNAIPDAEAYSLTIGTSPGAADVVEAPDLHTTSYLAPPITTSELLYARLGTEVAGIWRYSDLSFTSVPSAAMLLTPGPGAANVPLSSVFAWTTVPNADAYSLELGTAPGANDVFASGDTTESSLTVSNMPSSTTVYAHLGTRAHGIWRYVDSSFRTELVLSRAVFTSPAAGSTAPPGTVVFQWTPVASALGYSLRIGSAPGAADFGESPQTPDTSYTALLPAGLTVFARLYTQSAPGDLSRYVDLTFRTASASAGPDDPPPAGLVAAYDFDEGSGTTVADASGHGNTGFLRDAVWTTGRTGAGLLFNGTSAWVTVPDAASLELTTRMTLEAWVKPASYSAWWNLIQKESPDGLSYSLYGDDASRPAGYIHSRGADVGTHGPTPPSLDTWVHLATTYDGAVLRIYVNGVEVGNESAPGSIAVSTSPLRIGGDLYWGEFFHGVLDDVRIWADVRTPEQIMEDMSTPVLSSGGR